MRDGGTNQPAPVVHDGTMYLANTGGIVQALDAQTGDLIWEHHVGAEISPRGITLYREHADLRERRRVGRAAASRAARSRSTHARARPSGTSRCPNVYATNSGPIVVNGLLIQGGGTCTVYEETKCSISAYDAATGAQRWLFRTVALDGEPGGDSWGGLPDLYRAGGEAWITGSYDPELNLTYWGTAQAKPWMPASRGMNTTDVALYTSSTLALDASDGRARSGTTRTRPAKRSISTSCSSACSSTPAREVGVLRRQGRRAVEARSADRRIPRPQGNGVSERLGELRSRDGPAALPRPTFSRARSANGSTRARARRAARTGTR